VINGRPYKKVEDLKKVPGVNSRLYGIVEKKICCIPVAVEAPVVVEPPVVVEEPVKKDEPVEPVAVEAPVVVVVEKVNVNTATLDELTSTGLNKQSAREIISYRKKNGNYEKLEDLLVLQYFGNTCMKRYGHMLEV
jgi:competence ComEA-like helix-hairpin-helix protein